MYVFIFLYNDLMMDLHLGSKPVARQQTAAKELLLCGCTHRCTLDRILFNFVPMKASPHETLYYLQCQIIQGPYLIITNNKHD